MTRNEKTISTLKSEMQDLAWKWVDRLEELGIKVLVYCGRRTKAEQKILVAQGKSKTMKSYHISGNAIDACPLNEKNQCIWDDDELWKIMAEVWETLDSKCEAGYYWERFVDKCHYQRNPK